MRTDPPMSVPRSQLLKPAATAAAEPPDEPPTLRLRSHGLFVVPNSSLWVSVSALHQRGTLVLPTMTAPAARSAATAGASSDRDVILQFDGPAGAAHPGDRDRVLDRHRDARQRTDVLSPSEPFVDRRGIS